MHRVNRLQLLQVLGRVEPGRSTKDYLEQSSCFVFDNGWCVCFNDEICVRTKTELPEELSGAVHGKPLLEVLENMSDEEVDLRTVDGELQIRGNRKKAGVRMEAEIVLPVDQVEKPASWTPLPGDFSEAVKQVCAVAGTNDEEFLSVCVHVHPQWLEACDRRQAARYNLETGVSRPFLVRAKSLAHVAPLGVVKIGETDSWVHFRNKTLVFSIRRHLDEYPDIGGTMDFTGTPAVLPRGAAEAAKLGGVFSGEDKENDKVSVRLSPGRMQVRGEGAHGWAQADLEMDYRGTPLEFRVAPAVLEQLVRDHTQCEVTADKLRVVGEHWVYVTALGKPDAPRDEEPEPAAVAAGGGDDDHGD